VLPPIDPNGGSVFNQKSIVPVRFRLCDANGGSVDTPGGVTSFLLTQIVQGTTTTTVLQTPDSTTPDTEFRSAGQQWIFNLSTKDLSPGATYTFRIGLADGSAIVFRFGLK